MVGLGTGSTVAYLLPALAARGLRVRCVATSPRTEAAARELGLDVQPFEGVARLDIAIDGADQVAPDGWLIKGGGGAHTREKIVAAAADRFVVIASSNKAVEALAPPVPLELLAFGLRCHAGRARPGRAARRAPQPDGGVIADYHGAVDDPAALGRAPRRPAPAWSSHGLFAPGADRRRADRARRRGRAPQGHAGLIRPREHHVSAQAAGSRRRTPCALDADVDRLPAARTDTRQERGHRGERPCRPTGGALTGDAGQALKAARFAPFFVPAGGLSSGGSGVARAAAQPIDQPAPRLRARRGWVLVHSSRVGSRPARRASARTSCGRGGAATRLPRERSARAR